MSAVAPQAVGGQGIIPFHAASHKRFFDAVTSDSFTPGANLANLFQGNAAAIKPDGYLRNLWLKLTTSGGVAGSGVLAADAPYNALASFRFVDPNGHAIIDTDGYGLFLLEKYGGRHWIADPSKLPGANVTSVVGFLYDHTVPFELNPYGVGSLPNMDNSGPYRLQVQGNTQAAIYSTVTGLTSPLVSVAVGIETWTLPAERSAVNGAPQMVAPPGLDRGFAVVCEYTKQAFSIQSGGGQQAFRLTRVGNILRQLFFVIRNSSGARISWTASTLAAGSLLQMSFDTVPLFNADPVHLYDDIARKRGGWFGTDTGVMPVEFSTPNGMAGPQDSFDGGVDSMIQTAGSSAIEIAGNWQSGASTLECYTQDVTITSLTGQPYSFAYAGQLLAPVQPSFRS